MDPFRQASALLLTPLTLTGCIVVPIVGETVVTTTLVRSDDQNIGKVYLTAVPEGVNVRIEAVGLPPGPHGAHVHSVGRCDRRDFRTAGPHWDLEGRSHGRANPAGPHDGDLGNVSVGLDGKLAANVIVPKAVLPVPGARAGQKVMRDADGAALVIHAMADDERTDPTGNSGEPIACSVLAAPLQR